MELLQAIRGRRRLLLVIQKLNLTVLVHLLHCPVVKVVKN